MTTHKVKVKVSPFWRSSSLVSSTLSHKTYVTSQRPREMRSGCSISRACTGDMVLRSASASPPSPSTHPVVKNTQLAVDGNVKSAKKVRCNARILKSYLDLEDWMWCRLGRFKHGVPGQSSTSRALAEDERYANEPRQRARPGSAGPRRRRVFLCCYESHLITTTRLCPPAGWPCEVFEEPPRSPRHPLMSNRRACQQSFRTHTEENRGPSSAVLL